MALIYCANAAAQINTHGAYIACLYTPYPRGNAKESLFNLGESRFQRPGEGEVVFPRLATDGMYIGYVFLSLFIAYIY